MSSLPFKAAMPKTFVGFRKRRAVLLSVALVPLLLIGGYFLFFNKPAADDGKKHAVLTVAVEPVARHEIDRKLTITGSIWAWDPLSLGAEINGLRIETVDAEEGSTVAKGQVLATLNSSLIRAALEKEEARLRAAEAMLVKTVQPNRPWEMDAIQSSVDQMKAGILQEEANVRRAKSNLENAKRNSERFAGLAVQGAVSTKEADDRKTSEEMAEAELHQAQQRLTASKSSFRQTENRWKLAVEGGRKEDILISKASLAETQANIHQLRAQLAQTVIRAPASGLITKRDAHIGDISTINKPLFYMIRDSRIEMRAEVPEVDLAKLVIGQTVQVNLPNNAGVIPGRVRLITPQVDPNTRLATVRIDVPFNQALLPGMYVKGTADLGKQSVIAVPTGAVINRDDRSMVFVVGKDDQVVSKLVTLGESFGGRVEILSGLEPGMPVVIVGSGFLKDGDSVKIGVK